MDYYSFESILITITTFIIIKKSHTNCYYREIQAEVNRKTHILQGKRRTVARLREKIATLENTWGEHQRDQIRLGMQVRHFQQRFDRVRQMQEQEFLADDDFFQQRYDPGRQQEAEERLAGMPPNGVELPDLARRLP